MPNVKFSGKMKMNQWDQYLPPVPKNPVKFYNPLASPGGGFPQTRLPWPAGGAAAVPVPPDANEAGGPAPCRKWLRREAGPVRSVLLLCGSHGGV